MNGSLNLLFLGTGTSHGVPMIGCSCPVCRSTDPRDKRTRCSALLCFPDGVTVLVDTAPDLRAQALAHGMHAVDAVLFTHAHADHVHGIDELRSLRPTDGRPIPCFGSPETLAEIREKFAYIFHPTQKGGGKPQLDLRAIDGSFAVCGWGFRPLLGWHGQLPVLGFMIGELAYLTDISALPEETLRALQGVPLLVLGALRQRPHETHFSLAQAIAVAEQVQAERTYFTHISHDLSHAAVERTLPPGMALAYDGLAVTCKLPPAPRGD